MNFVKYFIILISFWSNVLAEIELHSELLKGIISSQIGESGGFFIHGVEPEVFNKYIQENWKTIADNIEILPPAESGERGVFLKKEYAINASVSNFAAACEILSPVEYLEFLDKWMQLWEEDRIVFSPISLTFLGVSHKQHFLSVNYEHPRVKAIIEKAIKLTPGEETQFLEMLKQMENGDLADTYMENKSDNAPRPETLPGIKLKRPWGSIIKQYERLTGKKAPYDPEFDPRPSKRGDGKTSGSKAQQGETHSSILRWIAGGLIAFLSILGLWKIHNGKLQH